MAEAVANLLLEALKGSSAEASGRDPVARQIDNIFQAASATTAGLIDANRRRIALSGTIAVRGTTGSGRADDTRDGD